MTVWETFRDWPLAISHDGRGDSDILPAGRGEGDLCGGSTRFQVRFGGCNVVCDYCDTPESIPAKSGRPWPLRDVLEKIQRLDEGKRKSAVSLTGGEPLVQVGFLESLIPELRKSGHQIYLETNGTLPRALEKIVEGCDWVAMDIKFKSAIGRDMCGRSHRWFLETAGSKVFVKIVLTSATLEKDLRRAVDLISGVRRDIPLVLQPATAWGRASSIPLARLVSWWTLATQHLSDV